MLARSKASKTRGVFPKRRVAQASVIDHGSQVFFACVVWELIISQRFSKKPDIFVIQGMKTVEIPINVKACDSVSGIEDRLSIEWP